jgi:hypothetical protein
MRTSSSPVSNAELVYLSAMAVGPEGIVVTLPGSSGPYEPGLGA